jgi:glucose/arabinose dehydrogenase
MRKLLPRAGLLGAALLLAAAAPDQVLTGPAALTDWHADAPGVRRLIRPQDVPAPYETRSASNAPGISERPGGAMPRVPAGFTVSLWAAGLSEPRVVRTAPDGMVFVAESGAGRVLAYHPRPDGSAGQATVFASGLERPFGIAFYPPGPAPRFVYIAETGRVVRYPWSPGVPRANGKAEVIVPRLPTGGHWTRDLAFSPDGRRLFVSVGSDSNLAQLANPPGGWQAWQDAHGLGAAWGEEAGRADVLAFDPEGHGGQAFATGLRNCAGLTVQPGNGALWCAVNERDGLGDNLPPDYATHVAQGGFYGWPWFYIGQHPDPRLHGAGAELAAHVVVPDVLIPPHSAPLGIAFYTGTLFPAEYRGDAFVALHGSWNRAHRTGYKVVRLRMQDGRPTGEVDDFLTGFVADDGEVWGRPVDVAVAPDGSLLVTEDGNGTIWRVAH